MVFEYCQNIVLALEGFKTGVFKLMTQKVIKDKINVRLVLVDDGAYLMV